VLRSWCGAEAVERLDELVELRKEIKNLTWLTIGARRRPRPADLRLC